MKDALAANWNSDFAINAAHKISSMSGIYCGPAAVGWIAATWNNSKGKRYDLTDRLNNKGLFPDGPRLFHGRIPGFQLSLNDLLLRETNGALRLSREIYFNSRELHVLLAEHGMPVVIRLMGKNLRNGLHYVVAYHSDLDNVRQSVAFRLQDNGVFANEDSGLFTKEFNSSHSFFWGAKRVVVDQSG